MIERSSGTITGYGYLAGSGFSGKTEELDNVIQKEAEILSELFQREVVIRFNSDRLSGAAFIKDGKNDDSLGLGAQIYNEKLFELLQKDANAYFELPKEKRYIYENTFDSIRFSVLIDAEKVISTSAERYKNFPTLDEAVNHLKASILKLNF